MNKLFSTLCAGLVLAAVGTTTASAIKLKADGTYNDKLYQISVGTTGDSVVFMTSRADGIDSLYVKSMSDISSAELSNTLWCVAMTKPAAQGQRPIFDFLNKATGKKLAIDIDATWVNETLTSKVATPVGTDLEGWAFSADYLGDLETQVPLYTYIPGEDSIAALGYDNSGSGTNQGLQVMKLSAKQAKINSLLVGQYVFTIQSADRIALNAEALHTILGSRESAPINLNFFKKLTCASKETQVDNDKIMQNVFAQDLVARDSTLAGVFQGVLLMRADNGKYLRVDTAYHNASGTGFLMLTDTSKVSTFEASQTATTSGNYLFHMSYAPEGDSLFIRVDEATYKLVGGTAFNRTTSDADSTYIILQDLEKDKSWALTAGWDTIRTRIGLGFGTCGDVVATNRVSVDQGLYTIKNKDNGNYFALPLYQNGAAVLWTEFDEDSQLAAHMPAYRNHSAEISMS